jgi:hypothetical protein
MKVEGAWGIPPKAQYGEAIDSDLRVNELESDPGGGPGGSPDVEGQSEKRLELHSWIWGRGNVVIVVRPNSQDSFVTMIRRMPGGSVRSVSSRRSWKFALIYTIALYAVVSALSLWLFAYGDALTIGVIIVVLVGLALLPQFWLLAWPFLPAGQDGTSME